uniref:PAT complex subunit CCDC47 n=1 Tax=Ciona savignyi TaxID=51511 RepID=H2YJ03_CIOSA
MLVELKLLKRQDLISVIAHRMKPSRDQVTISISMISLPSIVFCVGNKKSVANLHKNMQDLSLYCTDKARGGEKCGLPSSVLMLSELYGDVVNLILDSTVVRVLKDNEQTFDSLHISDQYSGAKPIDQEDDNAATPETTKKIVLVLNLPEKSSEIADMVPLLKMVIYLGDKLKKMKLSRESQQKADKHRADVADRYLKQTHAQRQEAAQLKKEEKARALKERMMNEDDPEKQRRLD